MYSIAIHRRSASASLVEINQRMSELLDNQFDTQNENLKIKIPGFTQALVKCVMKIKKDLSLPCKIVFNERRTL